MVFEFTIESIIQNGGNIAALFGVIGAISWFLGEQISIHQLKLFKSDKDKIASGLLYFISFSITIMIINIIPSSIWTNPDPCFLFIFLVLLLAFAIYNSYFKKNKSIKILLIIGIILITLSLGITFHIFTDIITKVIVLFVASLEIISLYGNTIDKKIEIEFVDKKYNNVNGTYDSCDNNFIFLEKKGKIVGYNLKQIKSISKNK